MTFQSLRPIATKRAIICMFAGAFAWLAAAPSGTSDAAVTTAPAANDENHEDADEGEEVTEAQGAAILIFWSVSFVLFFVSIRWMVAFWLLALLLASMGVGLSVEDVVGSIICFVFGLGSLLWMGVREIFGGGTDNA